MRSFSESYRDAGVNIEAGYEGVKLMKKHVQRTMIPGVVSDIGGFGGLFAPDLTGMSEPVLVSGTDGVGTKQRIAQLMNKHSSVGIDCVAMCVNDIICCGAKPIFFLDYIAIGKNAPEKVATLVSGVAEGCVQSGCALIGGETAEHPGTMSADDYDLAGFAVGIVDRAKIIDHDRMRPGDVVIALTSSGIHSNGYSLVRKVFNVEHADLGAYVDELGCTLGEELLRPTKIYVKPVLAALDAADTAFALGAVGAGRGMSCYHLKGGIGSASRVFEIGGQTDTLGALAMTNFGSLIDRTIAGERIGKKLAAEPEDAKGSCIMVLATDAPLSSRQLSLKRWASRSHRPSRARASI